MNKIKQALEDVFLSREAIQQYRNMFWVSATILIIAVVLCAWIFILSQGLDFVSDNTCDSTFNKQAEIEIERCRSAWYFVKMEQWYNDSFDFECITTR